MGKVRDHTKKVMFCIHIWIPDKILSILSLHTRGKNEVLPPTVREDQNIYCLALACFDSPINGKVTKALESLKITQALIHQ